MYISLGHPKLSRVTCSPTKQAERRSHPAELLGAVGSRLMGVLLTVGLLDLTILFHLWAITM